MLYKAQQTIFNLFNNYSTIASEAKYKAIYGKGQILQRLPILRIWMPSNPIFFVQKKLLNDFNKGIIKNRYYICEFWK